MKIIIHSLLVLSIVQLFNPIKVETALKELIDHANKYDYMVESGELIIKETFPINKKAPIVKQLIKQDFLQDNHLFTRNLTADLQETVTIVETPDRQKVTVNYHLTGNVNLLNENNRHQTKANSLITTIYTRNMRDFACIKFNIRDMIFSRYFFENIKKEWNYKEIDRIEEPDQVVISGYSANFNQKIPYKNQDMNLQISVKRGETGKNQIMIGTPILMTEY